jgi:hypothetical protein
MVNPRSFRPWNSEQTRLFPPSPVDWLPLNHLVFFLLDLAAELDLEIIHSHYPQKDPRVAKAYDPNDADADCRVAVSGAAPARLRGWRAQLQEEQ